MGAKGYQNQIQAATTSALSWSITMNDDCDVKAITLKMDTAPTSAGSITITLDSVKGAAYDTLIESVSAVGGTDFVFLDVGSFAVGDALLVEYVNTDSRSITGNCELDFSRD